MPASRSHISLRRCSRGAALVAAVLVALFVRGFSPPPALAVPTFTVNSTLDTGDAIPGDNLCDDGAGNCTLRAAIDETNNLLGPDAIEFSIGGGGTTQKISPATPLPEITDPVSIDGTTQCPCFVGIEVSGASCVGCTDGLDISGGGSTIKGLAINGFPDAGIKLRGPGGGNTLSRLWIGMDKDFEYTIVPPNGGAGVEIDGTTQPAAGNHIGVTGPGVFTTIVGNGGPGVLIHGAMATGNVIQNSGIGLIFTGSSTWTVAPNGSHGVFITDGAYDNTVGCRAPGPCGPANVNTIAYNHGAGVAVDAGSTGNTVEPDLMHDNDGLGIDLAPIGAPTQPYDGALTSAMYCPAGCQGFPGGMFAGTGYVRGAPPSTAFRLGAYFNTTCDPSGHGEAELPFLATFIHGPPGGFASDAYGNESASSSAAGPQINSSIVGKWLVDDITLPDGTTLEHSNCVQVKSDADRDGIENSVDPLPATFSDAFDGTLIGGTAFGTIVDRGGCYVSIVPLPVVGDGGTVGVICPNNTGGVARISACGLGVLAISDGQSVTGNCHSLDTAVGIGPVTETFGTIPATLPTKTTSTVTDLGGGSYQVHNDSASVAPIVVGGLSIPPGDTAIVQDSDADSLVDAADNCPGVSNPGQQNVIHPLTLAGDVCEDFDSDSFVDAADNCPSDNNPLQENHDSGPVPPFGNIGTIDNGTGIGPNDTTIPNGDAAGDPCDPDRDNDGLPDSQDTEPLSGAGICGILVTSDGHPNPAGGDVTNDDNGNGVPAPADGADNGPSWDTDNDGVLDGVECLLGSDPRSSGLKPSTTACGGATDADHDGLPASAERCKWGTSDTSADTDGDGKKDCVEANDTDGNGNANFTGDTINSAKAANNIIGKTMDFDLDGSGNVSFTGDTILSAKMALHVVDLAHPLGYCP